MDLGIEMQYSQFGMWLLEASPPQFRGLIPMRDVFVGITAWSTVSVPVSVPGFRISAIAIASCLMSAHVASG